MLREVNPAAARAARRSFRKHGTALRATCLLCRILWPIVVQHRHLPPDYSSAAESSERTHARSPKGQQELVATLIIRPA
jgi:hypothetical protein